MGQYDAIAENYHWLYSDHALCGEQALDENTELLANAGPEARILDCSCGIGSFVIALAKRRFEVSGTDGSQGMIEQAILASENAGLSISLSCCQWEDLPAHLANRFDLVFCLGNSIGHTRNKDEMVRSLEGMRGVLKSGGKVVIQSRNWEQLRKERTRFTHFQWRERAGQRCLPLYVWTFPEKFDDAHTIEVVLIFDRAGKVSVRSYPIVYYPFRLEELEERLRCAGFSEILNNFSESNAEYRVIAS